MHACDDQLCSSYRVLLLLLLLPLLFSGACAHQTHFAPL